MREEKQFLLDEVQGQIERHGSFLILSYFGLDANTSANFRRQIANMGGEMEVMKKRILVKAAKNAGIDLDPKILQGHIGLVFAGNDAVQTTKAVFQLRKDTNKAVEVLGGRFDGQTYNGSQVEMLSELPGIDGMRSLLLATLEAPMAQTVSVMNSLLCCVLYCMENKAKD